LNEEELRKRRLRGRSASGEFDEPPKEPAIFEPVDPMDDPFTEFKPVEDGDHEVEWEAGEEVEIMEERFEAILEDLFGDPAEDAEAFKEVTEELGWAPGEVIWEGMDFEAIFTDREDFQTFERLSKKEKRAFIRDRLKGGEGSLVAFETEIEHRAEDLDITISTKTRRRRRRRSE
jgi:hypothetical protein